MTIQKGSCHCGRARFEVAEEAHGASRCDCSLCRREAAVILAAAKEVSCPNAGKAHLSLHQENPKPRSIISFGIVNSIAFTAGAANLNMAIIHAALTGLIHDSLLMRRLLGFQNKCGARHLKAV